MAAYAAGSLGTGVFSTVPTILLLYFCTEVLSLPAQWATAIVLAPKLWSIVWDPLVGSWSDRTTSPLGRRRPFLIAGTVGVALAFIAVFSPPTLDRRLIAWWMAGAYFALATLYSLFAVPYIGIPAEIGGTPQERARLVASRMFIAMIGVLTGAGVAPLVVQLYGGGRGGYARMSLWLAAACMITMSLPLLVLRGRDAPRAAAATPARLPRSPFHALRNARFASLGVAYLLQITAVGVVSSAAPYLVTRCFGRGEGSIGTAMLVMLAATTITIPAWSLAGRRFGENRMLACGIASFAALSLALGLLASMRASWTLALGGFACLGVPFAAMQVLPFTMVTHLIRAECDHGPSAEGSYTGVWTGMEKLGLALGPAITGFVLWVFAGPRVSVLATLMAAAPPLLAVVSLGFLHVPQRSAPSKTVAWRA